MTAGKARVALTTLLVLPLAATAWLSGGTAPPAAAAASSPSRMVGPLNPPLIDTDGDGKAGTGDQSIGLTRTGSQIVIDSPWDCGHDTLAKTINLSSPDGNGRFQTLSRTAGGGRISQSISITSFMPNGTPAEFSFVEYNSPGLRFGTGQVVDANQDGIIDGVSGVETDGRGSTLTGGNSFAVSLVQSDTNGDGNPDYISIPWSQASAVGVNTADGCGPSGGDPQIWIPMADTNDDGVNDGIVPDLDGDGNADGDLFVGRGVARPSGTTRYIGPNFPVLIDTSADGRPTPGADANIIPQLVGNEILLFTPWYDRNGSAHRLIMENPDANGRFTSIKRSNGSLLQTVQFTGFTGGFPTGFTVSENGPHGLRTGGLQLVDRNGDGIIDGFVGLEDVSGGIEVSGSFITADGDGDGRPDYISIPWSQASAIGVNLNDGVGPGQGGTDPQIWLPLADTNGDGVGDTVGFDFNGDGIADPGLWSGPLVGVGAPAPFTPGGKMIGPVNPPLIDTNGDGRPSQGDTTIGIARTGNQVTITSPWDCSTNDSDNVFRFTQPDTSGRFRTASRSSIAGSQSLTITGFSGNGAPQAFAFNQRGARNRTGTGALLDANHDGIVDGVQGTETTTGLSGPGLHFSLSLIQVDINADGNPDYVSIPWSQATAVGVNTTDQCGPGGRDPQVWLPMADTDGDGYNDGIVPDLDGDNVADSDLFRGGAVARPNGTTRYVGPNYPILIDTSGDGRPTPGVDLGVFPERVGNQLYLNSPWNTDPASGAHIVTLEDPNNTGKFSKARRTNGSRLQEIDINAFGQTSCAPGGGCTTGAPVGMDVTQSGGRNRHGSLRLVDRNGDGIYEGFSGAEVGGDELKISVSFVLSDADGDGKPDYISIPWSQASAMGVNTRDTIGPSGVDPQLWVPLADTNGDGIGDAVVLDLNGDGVPDPDFYSTPAMAGGSTRYTMAEGSANGFFDSWLLVANPTSTATTANVTYFKDTGATVTQALQVPALSRVTVSANALAGLAPSAFGFTLDAPASVPLGVERAMYYDSHYVGGHAEAAATSTDTRWLFAEGCQRSFETYFLLTNPGSTAAQATLTFLLEGGQPAVTRVVTVPATSRVNFLAANVPELTGRPFGTIVESDQPIVAERAMFFSSYTGSHESIGSRVTSPYWYHPEGAIGSFFDTFLLLMNPDTRPAAVTVTVRPATGTAITRNITIPARSRFTYSLDNDLEPTVAGTLSISVNADRPIVSERSMYWGGPPENWAEGHNSLGETDPGTKWVLAEGAVGGPVNFDTYLLLGNPSAVQAAVRLTFLRQGGAPVVKTVSVAANGRVDYNVNTLVPEIAGESFSVVAEVTNGVPIVVERSMYWTPPGGGFWAGGSNAVARRLP